MRATVNQENNFVLFEPAQNGNSGLANAYSDYSVYLRERNIVFARISPYLIVGDLTEQHGWLIHVSIVQPQWSKVFNELLGYLHARQLPFVMPESVDWHRIILDGRCGLSKVGKVITVFCQDGSLASVIVSYLNKITDGCQGPDVITAVHLTNCIYVSYGIPATDIYLQESPDYSIIEGYDPAGRLLKQLNALEINWPFGSLKMLKRGRRSQIINKQYIPVQVLKTDPKGMVLKCIKLNRLFDLQWCVLKQGKAFQSYDDYSRDAKTRLNWQYTTGKLLQDSVAVAKVWEEFDLGANRYLAMEYIEGVSLSEHFSRVHQGVLWPFLNGSQQSDIINCLLQVVRIVQGFHEKGYIHRDVTPGNFLVNDQGKVVAIDIELCYNKIADLPSPAFTLGTIGYISPQQQVQALPQYEDDIYSIGALFIKAFTGLSPVKLPVYSPDHFYNDLRFLIRHDEFPSLICKCLNPDIVSRPSLAKILDSLLGMKETLSKSGFLIPVRSGYQNPDQVSFIIQNALNCLADQIMLGAGSEWITKQEKHGRLLDNDNLNYEWRSGFYNGASGILYAISKAREQGFEINSLNEIIDLNLSYISRETEGYSIAQPGLWYGNYSFLILNSIRISEGLPEDKLMCCLIDQAFSTLNGELNIANGLAGLGLCLLHIVDSSSNSAVDKLHDISRYLLERQEKDGSWKFSNGSTIAGFSYGVAGLVYYLLGYYARFPGKSTKAVITKSLNWLITQRKKENGRNVWAVNKKSKLVDPWLENGFSGIALTFIKAYEVFHDPLYKDVAIAALVSHPKHISSSYFSLGNGISGVGEIYLEAYRVFKDPEWQERARYIAEFLMHTYNISGDKNFYWIDGHLSKPTGDLMTGNSGIIYFLLHYSNPDQMNFFLTFY